MFKDGRITSDILEKARKIKFILMIKHFNAHDGLGVKLARAAGIKTGIISARESGTIRKRAAEIKMDYLNLGRFDKLPAFKEFLEESQINPEECCFIGDDLPDIPVMRQVGLAVAVRNATDLVKENAHYITQKAGGDGAVREVIELILDAQGKLSDAIQKIWNE